MKKNILFTMVVMLMTAVSTFAQKEYNMVITLSNGTTVTLGHNDIKEITFNDGKVAITGNMVNTIDSLAGVAQATKGDVNDLRSELQQQVSYLESGYAALTNIIKDNADAQNEVTNTIWAEVQNQKDSILWHTDILKKISSEMDSRDDAVEKCMGLIVANQQEIQKNSDNTDASIKALKARTDEVYAILQRDINDVNEHLQKNMTDIDNVNANLKGSVADLQGLIQELQTEIANLKQQLKESGATTTAKKR